MGKVRRHKLSNERRLISDVVRIAQQIPLAAIQKEFDVKELNSLRMKTRPRISWDVLMMRAYSLVGQDIPELRKTYTRFPRPYLYEHSHNVCLLTIARKYHGRERLFFARFGAPEQHSLSQLQEQYNHYRTAPVESIKQFRHQIWFARVPLPIRRFIWRSLVSSFPGKRASHLGTFGMSLSKFRNATGTKHLGPNTTTLGVDPHPRQGKATLLLTFDHRVMDGKPAAEILHRLSCVLADQVANELKMLLRNQDQDPEKLLRAKQSQPETMQQETASDDATPSVIPISKAA